MEGEGEELVGTIFESLKKINTTKNSKLVLVHLPTEKNIRTPTMTGYMNLFATKQKKE